MSFITICQTLYSCVLLESKQDAEWTSRCTYAACTLDSVENTFQQMMFFWRIWGLAMKDMVQLFPKFEGNGLENEV